MEIRLRDLAGARISSRSVGPAIWVSPDCWTPMSRTVTPLRSIRGSWPPGPRPTGRSRGGREGAAPPGPVAGLWMGGLVVVPTYRLGVALRRRAQRVQPDARHGAVARWAQGIGGPGGRRPARLRPGNAPALADHPSGSSQLSAGTSADEARSGGVARSGVRARVRSRRRFRETAPPCAAGSVRLRPGYGPSGRRS